MNVLVYSLQIISIALAAILGIASTFFNLKNSEGKITAIGRGVILGIIISSIITLFISINDKLEQEEQEKIIIENSIATIHKTDSILYQINRNIHSLRKVDVEITSNLYEVGKGDLTKYLNDYDYILSDIEAEYRFMSRRSFSKIYNGISIERKGGYNFICIYPQSNLYPNVEKYPDLYRSLTQCHLQLSFSKQKRNLSDVYVKDGSGNPYLYVITEGDLNIDFDKPEKKGAVLMYLVKTGEIAARFMFRSNEEQLWDGDGEIISSLDLPGSHLIAYLDLLNDDINKIKHRAVNTNISTYDKRYTIQDTSTTYLKSKDNYVTDVVLK